MKEQIEHTKVILTDVYSVLDSLGGNITGDYREDLKRVHHVVFSQELYERAYKLSQEL